MEISPGVRISPSKFSEKLLFPEKNRKPVSKPVLRLFFESRQAVPYFKGNFTRSANFNI
jgi:hypothetical protein